jgi:hypothetical protein
MQMQHVQASPAQRARVHVVIHYYTRIVYSDACVNSNTLQPTSVHIYYCNACSLHSRQAHTFTHLLARTSTLPEK